MRLQKQLNTFDLKDEVHIDFSQCRFVDHSAVETLHLLEDDFKNAGGHLHLIGLHDFVNVGNSKHHAAARRKK
jgi:anti-anti-sigma regulatory factor